jgi:predicted MPP superfamily phosphohydrolase
VLGLFGFFAVFVPVQMARDLTGIDVRRFEIASAEVPADLDGFRLVLIADPQADRHTDAERLAEMTRVVNRLEPDLVLVAGDIITRDPGYLAAAASALGAIRARHGVFSCIGDHDNFAYRDRERSLREVREGLAKAGVPLLDNEVRTFTAGGAELAVVFATHNYVNRIDRDTIGRLLDGAATADLQVVVAHQAKDSLLADAAEHGADLFLSGHTHGGQVNFWLPGLAPAFVRFETPYVTGRFQIGTMSLIVSSGIGMSVAPFRYRAPATIELITFRHR